MKRNVINVMLGLFVAMVLGLTGCGGGGGSSDGGGAGTTDTVSGIAASGAVIAGSVYLKDSASTPKELYKTIATDGSYSFDVTGMTKPYLLKAVGTANGTNYTLYSLATDKGTANINPLSNLIVHNAAGVSDVGTVYSSPQLTTMQTIAGKIPQATTDVKTSILPLLTTYGVSTVNPITDTYKADHSGLDGMFDNVTVSVSSGTATIKNTSTGTTIFTSPVTSITTGTVTSGNIPQPSTYTISGAVTYNGAGLPGVTITLSGSSTNTATTDNGGNYTFTGVLNGSFTITPSKTDYTFSSNQTATVNGSNQTGLNFTATTAATPTYSISGAITDGNSALAGVTVTLTGIGSTTATTDNSGNYSFSGAQNGSYTITPSKSGYTFSPTSLSAAVSSANLSGKNFTASVATSNNTSTADVNGISGAKGPAKRGDLFTDTMTYIANGQTQTTSYSSFIFDSSGYLTGCTLTTSGISGSSNTSIYTFDNHGNIKRVLTNGNSSGTNFTQDMSLTYIYNTNGTISSSAMTLNATYPSSPSANSTSTTNSTYTYSSSGLIINKTQVSGAYTTLLKYYYDNGYNLTKAETTSNGLTSTVAYVNTYNSSNKITNTKIYDGNNRLIRDTNYTSSGKIASETSTYYQNSNGTLSSTTTYTYDANDYILSFASTGDYLPVSTMTYTYKTL